MHLPLRVVRSTSSLSVQSATPTMPSLAPGRSSSSFMAILPLTLMCRKSASSFRRTVPQAVANMTLKRSKALGSSGSGNTVVMVSPSESGNEIHHRLAAGVGRALGQAPDLQLVDLADGGEEQHLRMRVGDEEARDEILLARRHARASASAAPLGAIGRERHALDIARMRDGDHHVLALDEILVLDLEFLLDDLGAPRRRELLFQ